jgi:hypothetical protein
MMSFPSRLLQRTILLVCFLLVIIASQLSAESSDNADRIDSIRVTRTLFADSAGKFQLPEPIGSSFLLIAGVDTLTSPLNYQVSASGLLSLGSDLRVDSLQLIYYRPSLPIDRYYTLRPFQTTREFANPRTPPRQLTPPPEAVPGSNLKISGTKSFSADLSDRGNVSLEQGLALTLSGDLGHGIMVRGSFSDRGLRDNRLITKRFSELQNVYLEVESNQLSGRFGNFELRENRFEYLGLHRNVQGLSVQYSADNYMLSTSLSVPPGNFTTNAFLTEEGNFGPYLLRASDGQGGIAVLENSESVWYNGRKLNRGRDEDYYLDYLQGELFFTGRIVIDDRDRVRVDFEYQKKEYRKTLITTAATATISSDRLKLDLGAASLSAAKNDPLDFTLSPGDISVLEAAGDDPAKAIIPGGKFVGEGQGNYVIETDSAFGPIYRFVGDSLGNYQVSFSESDTGDYIYLGGGEYQFIGHGLGDYLPVKSVPFPVSATVASVSGQYQLASTVSLHSELAVSDYDRNRFSSLDDSDNITSAGNLKMIVGNPGSHVAGTVLAEYLPGDFYRFQRLDQVEEDYLWQRSATVSGNRQRYLASLSTSIGSHDRTDWQLGYTREGANFESSRAGLQTGIDDIARSRLDVGFDYTSSRELGGDRSLVRLKPIFRSQFLPVEITAEGLYDNQELNPATGESSAESKRELSVNASYVGLSAGVRQSEDWQRLTVWQMLERKRTIRAGINRDLPRRGKIALDLLVNRVDAADGGTETYQTGTFDLLWYNIADLLDVNSRLRLNRRGRQQTNQTYLKVDKGDGDYVLIDSVYVPQARGDYILVTEQVGDLTRTIEAEKQIRFDVDLMPLIGHSLGGGTDFLYDINLREIGAESATFEGKWLLPPESYFGNDSKFATRRYTYRLRRYTPSIGLKTELSYERRKRINLLDIRRPFESNSESGRLLINKRIAVRDFVEITLNASNSNQAQLNLYQFDVKQRGITGNMTKYIGPWEISGIAELGREWTDSLNLIATTYKLGPRIAYSLTNLGRVTFASSVYEVREKHDRPLLLEMADGFPVGTNYTGSVNIDFRVADNFDFKLAAQGDVRAGQDNRYFLRTELISRFR